VERGAQEARVGGKGVQRGGGRPSPQKIKSAKRRVAFLQESSRWIKGGMRGGKERIAKKSKTDASSHAGAWKRKPKEPEGNLQGKGR